MRRGQCSTRGCIIAIAAVCASVTFGIVSVAAQADQACLNEALRQELRSGQLPDCRAYELVSPVFKDGTSFNPNGIGLAVSGDGLHLIDVAFGAFAGTESNPYENTVYELSRTGSGWVVSALDPPGAMSPESNIFGGSRDLSKTLWGLHRPSQSIYEEDLYVREPDGRFIEIGPMVPQSYSSGAPSGTTTTFGRTSLIQSYYTQGGGASADLSHVLFIVKGTQGSSGVGDRWPGDGTVAKHEVNSLYEYAGQGLVRPTLVGVDNRDEQISQCGTDLGGNGFSGDKYNAVSADGETVFFTADAGGCSGLDEQSREIEGKGPAVNELYARIDGIEMLRLSEPLPSQCIRCHTAHTNVTTTEQSADFQGASEDGSKVFFTTEQELLEGQTTNNLYEYDRGSPAQFKIALASTGSPTPEVKGVARVSEDGSHVYFVAGGILTGANREGKTPTLGADNLYVFERDSAYPAGRMAFIATLAASDAQDWSARDNRPVEATPDGGFLAFQSSGDLTADDTSTVSQVFEYDAREEILVRVSVGQCESPAVTTCTSGERINEDGNTSTDPASIKSPDYGLRDSPSEAKSNLSLSDDGSYVAFKSANELTRGAESAAKANAVSVYEYHSVGSIADGNVYLISDGNDVTRGHGLVGTELLGIDAAGDDVFVETGDVLLGSDVNTGRDIYGVRIDGGFTEPSSPAECKGESCQGSLSSSLSSVGPGSASAAAGDNRVPLPPNPLVVPQSSEKKTIATKCRKGSKLSRGKCIKQKTRGKKKSKTKAKKVNRRGK
jgi:hypothetical protein